jgi:exoribonuclease-2
LDQIEYAEKLTGGGIRLLIGIADVDSLVRQGSAIDRHASGQTVSVYTGVTTFPLLPEELSTNASSLLGGQDRLAVVIELHIATSGEVSSRAFYLALVRNRAKLAYSSTGAWLEERGQMPAPIAEVPGMEDQLRLQRATAEQLRRVRKEHGALTFGSVEAVPIMSDGKIDLKLRQHTVAEEIIESFMVAANVAMAEYLKERGLASIRRVVRTPKRWDRIQALAAQLGTSLPDQPNARALAEFLERRKAVDAVHFPDLSLAVVKLLGPGEYMVAGPGAEEEGHFGLAVHDYTHSTAPNRRYADLITQRLLKATLAASPGPYPETELQTIAAHCTEREDAARKVERLMRKVIAASALSSRVGEEFDGIVTGASTKGTYVRLLHFPAEGRVVKGAAGIDVGDRVRLSLVSIDVERGFIDFAVL